MVEIKIDLHTHTKKLKQGDDKNRVIDTLGFIDKMHQNNVVICAITNHNHFDLQQFYEIEDEEPEFLLLPGIELDIEHEEGHYHFIVICNPRKAEEFEKIFDKDKERDYDNYILCYKELISKIKKFNKEDVIIFPHFGDKDKKRAINIETKDQLKNDLEDYLVILEAGKLHTMGIINAHEELSLVGSDVHDWSIYSSEHLPEIKFKINHFEDFIQLANHTPLFIRTYLNGTDSYPLKINNDRTDIGEIELYKDINILFGEKGSGKTFLLEEYIRPHFQDSGLNVVHHAGKSYIENYKRLIDSFEDKVTIDQEKFESASNYLDNIFKYSEKKPDNIIGQLLKYHENQTNNKKVKKIKKFISTYNKNTSTDIESVKRETSNNIRKLDDVSNININLENYRYKHNFESLNRELQILKKDMIEKTMEDFKEIFRIERTEKFLRELKNSINRQTGTTSRPTTIGFSRLVNQRLRRLQNNEALKTTLNELNTCEEFLLGELPIKGKVKLSVRYQVLKPEDKVHNSPFRQNTIVNNRNIIKKINSFDNSSFKNINTYFEGLIDGVNPKEFMNEIIKKTHLMSVGDNINYDPSEGERAILTVAALLEDDSYDVYLFDELERGLGQKYLSDYVIPKLKRLRDNGKIVIVSTHNSNLAVNTLPGQTVYCDYSPGSNEIYYVGNMYENELKCTYSDRTVKWNNTALIHLEGTKTMFKVRRNTFGIN